MILYVDETENDEYFIVAGLVVRNYRAIDLAYRHFKNRVNNYQMKLNSKEKVYREFKSTAIDKHYQKVKNTMLEEIDKINNHFIIYSTQRKQRIFKQIDKERAYICLLSRIAEYCGEIDIIYDSFNSRKIDKKIREELFKFANVRSIIPRDSQEEPGLQFADNICSAIRYHISFNDRYKYFEKIESKVVEI